MRSPHDYDGDTNTKEADQTHPETCIETAAQVLELPELLENILSYLPPRDILFSQSVAARWRDVVKKSPRLQRSLFVRQNKDAGAVEVVREDRLSNRDKSLFGRRRILNTLLQRQGWVKEPRNTFTPTRYYCPVLTINPLLFRQVGIARPEARSVNSPLDFTTLVRAQMQIGSNGPFGGLLRLLDDFATSKSYSCHQMLLTDPPTPNVDVVLRLKPKNLIPETNCCVCTLPMLDPTEIFFCGKWGCRECIQREHQQDQVTCPGCWGDKCHKYRARLNTPVPQYQTISVTASDVGVRFGDVLDAITKWYTGSQVYCPEDQTMACDRVLLSLPAQNDFCVGYHLICEQPEGKSHARLAAHW